MLDGFPFSTLGKTGKRSWGSVCTWGYCMRLGCRHPVGSRQRGSGFCHQEREVGWRYSLLGAWPIGDGEGKEEGNSAQGECAE